MKVRRISAQRENTKTRVAAYCRVSTEKDSQEDSLEMQREAYLAYISTKPDWVSAGVYSDAIADFSGVKTPPFRRSGNRESG